MTEGAGRSPKNVLTRQKLLYPVPGSQTMSMIAGKRGRATSGISDERNTVEIVVRPLFLSSPLTDSLEQAKKSAKESYKGSHGESIRASA